MSYPTKYLEILGVDTFEHHFSLSEQHKHLKHLKGFVAIIEYTRVYRLSKNKKEVVEYRSKDGIDWYAVEDRSQLDRRTSLKLAELIRRPECLLKQDKFFKELGM